MLVSEIKPIGKVGKNLLKNKNSDELINLIIEKPLQNACRKCKNKNIETVMSSCNKKNIVKEEKRIKKCDIEQNIFKNKNQTFLELGKGYAWIMINYNSLSDDNKKLFFELEKEFGEEVICFVKSNYVEVINPIRKFFKIKPLVENFDDKFSDNFKEKQLLIMYNNKYPRRTIFIRMPINDSTTVKDVELFFDKIIDRLNSQ